MEKHSEGNHIKTNKNNKELMETTTNNSQTNEQLMKTKR